MALVEELRENWQSRLESDCSGHSSTDRESIVFWLLGSDVERYDDMTPDQLAIAQQAMDYRYRILLQRYLGVHPDQAYRKLLQRLGSLFLIRSKIRTWVSLSRDRSQTVMEVLQEVIQELMQSDTYMRQQMTWISQCTKNSRLRNILMLASVEEYCLRPIRNQPLLVYRFVNYLRRSQRGGMTQVPAGDLIRLVSEEITPDDSENPVSLLDNQAVADHQDREAWEEQQFMREQVRQEFSQYLVQEVDPMAAEWLKLYLEGHSQDAIATMLHVPIKQIYRLREKVSYHAIRVFSLKTQPEMVMAWLGISLREHSLGLTPDQWSQFWSGLTAEQQRLIDRLKAGHTVDAIAKELNLKPSYVLGEWSKLYLTAQTIRSES
jgi:DNA-directed RNA polymerase specialized sigma24 family protein